jgi:hypothetical protein
MTYPQDKMQRGPIYCRNEESRTANHIIVYTGGRHTDIYVRFIKKCFNVDPEISVMLNTREKCLRLPYPFDFFKDKPINSE